jgi:O-antigen/teichoic acid export membrane protein
MFAAFGTVLRVGAQLLLLPSILLYLSPVDQAMWWMFVALGNLANLADFGFGQAITRIYSFLWAGADDFESQGLLPPTGRKNPNMAGIARLHRTVQHLYWRLCWGAMAVLAVAGTVYLFNAVGQTAQANKVWVWWPFYLLAIGFNFGTSYWLLACMGIDRVRQVQFAQIISSLVFLSLVFLLLKLGWGLAGMVIGTIARGFVLQYISRKSFYEVVPRMPHCKPDFAVLRRIWPNARKFGILSIGGYWAANGLVLLSGCFLGIETTAAVGVTTTAGSLLLNFSGLWLSVKWPQLTFLRAQGRLEEMSFLFARRLAFAVLTFLVMATAVASLGNPILAWKHSHTRLIELPFLLVYLIYLLQQLIYSQFATLVYTENVIPFCKASVVTVVVMITLGLILTPLGGLWGLILSPLLAETFFSAWVVIQRGFVSQTLGLQRFCRFALLGRL